MTKKKLLIFIDWYYPAFKAGGPIKSVHNIVMAFKNELDISIVTSAYDLDGVEMLQGTILNEWIDRDGVRVIYLDKEHQNKEGIKRLIEEVTPDTVYFNSLFSKAFTLAPLSISKKMGVKKIILAPRGMLGKAALSIKPLKKQLFILFAKVAGIFKGITWHASSVLEQNEIQHAFGTDVKVVIAQNISGLVTKRTTDGEVKKQGELKLVFFSRINEKKNIKFAIQAVSQLNKSGVSLAIYGPIEDKKYWQECQELIEASSCLIEYKGLIHPTNLTSILDQYHFLLFPTKHENYGHVITEALCASLPLIISQHTPWRNLEQENVGFDLPLSVDSFVEVFNKLLLEDDMTYVERLNSCIDYSKRNIVNSSVIDQNKNLFL